MGQDRDATDIIAHGGVQIAEVRRYLAHKRMELTITEEDRQRFDTANRTTKKWILRGAFGGGLVGLVLVSLASALMSLPQSLAVTAVGVVVLALCSVGVGMLAGMSGLRELRMLTETSGLQTRPDDSASSMR